MTTIKLSGNTTMMTLSAIRGAFDCFDASGKKLEVGDKVTDFRGDTLTFGGLTRPPAPGKSAKVMLEGREMYDKVASIDVRLRDPDTWIDKAEAYGARLTEDVHTSGNNWICSHNVASAEFGETKAEAAFWFCVEHNLG